jgi:hypothetical protein
MEPMDEVFDDELGFLLGAAIVAPPPHGNPLWMLVDPLRDVGLRIHHALMEPCRPPPRLTCFFCRRLHFSFDYVKHAFRYWWGPGNTSLLGPEMRPETGPDVMDW